MITQDLDKKIMRKRTRNTLKVTIFLWQKTRESVSLRKNPHRFSSPMQPLLIPFFISILDKNGYRATWKINIKRITNQDKMMRNKHVSVRFLPELFYNSAFLEGNS